MSDSGFRSFSGLIRARHMKRMMRGRFRNFAPPKSEAINSLPIAPEEKRSGVRMTWITSS